MSEKTCVAGLVGPLMRCTEGAAVIVEPDPREMGVNVHDKLIMDTNQTKRTESKPAG